MLNVKKKYLKNVIEIQGKFAPEFNLNIPMDFNYNLIN